MTQIAWRLALVAAAAAVLLAGCSAHAGDVTACKAALKKAMGQSMQAGLNHQTTPPATRPPECDGVSDDQVKALVNDLLTEAFAQATTSPTDTTTTDEDTTTTTTQPAIARHKLGETAEVWTEDTTDPDAFSGSITVQAVASRKKTSSPIGERPKFGRYVTVTLTAQGKSGRFSINPYDFYLLGPDGTRYGYAEGNSATEEPPTPLDAADLKPGERLKGQLVFDAPASATTLGYAPGFNGGGDTIATWTLG